MRRPLPTAPPVLLAAIVALGISGCVTPGRPGTDRTDPYRLTSSELRGLADPTAYDAIRRLRPQWLRSRGAGFSARSTPTVYVDGLRRGGPEALRDVGLDDVRELVFLSPADATTYFGTNNAGGAIVMSTRR